METKKIERREYRDRRETDRTSEKLCVRFSGTLCPHARGQEQRLKSNKHHHKNEDFIAGEIFLRNKERADPGELHQRRSNRAKDRQRIPALSLRQREETDIE